MPLAPGGNAAIQSEEGEDCAGGFVKELADGAPHYAQSDFGGTPEHGVEALGHGTILVQNAWRRGSDWRAAGGLVLRQQVKGCDCLVVGRFPIRAGSINQALADHAVIISVPGSSFRMPCTGWAFS